MAVPVPGIRQEPEPAPTAPPMAQEVETVLTQEALDRWIERLRGAEITALGTETDSLDPVRARIIGVSF